MLKQKPLAAAVAVSLGLAALPALAQDSTGSAAKPSATATAAASGFCFNILTLLNNFPRAGVSLPRAQY